MDSKYWGTEVAYKNGYAAGVNTATEKNKPAPTTSLPSNWCGECPVWLAMGEMESLPIYDTIGTYCVKCKAFNAQKFVQHIPTQCCYPLELDGKTIMICGAPVVPEIDDKFWRYVDHYIHKAIVPVDPILAAMNK